jgi:hypothetical protein
MQQLFAALRGNQVDTDRFMGVMAGTTAVPEFFAPENLGRIIGSSAHSEVTSHSDSAALRD